MIISCNKCQKSFVVPDSAVTNKGRLVQCSVCGNKWTQYPIKKQKSISGQKNIKKIKKQKTNNLKSSKTKKPKRTGPTLYSSEYLEEKHGIKISDKSTKPSKQKDKNQQDESIGFGFYSYLLFFLIFILSLFGILNLTKDILTYNFPFLSIYIDHLYETLFNIKKIIINFTSNY